MKRPAGLAYAALTVEPAGDLLPVRVQLDHRPQGGTGLVQRLNPFEVHLGEAPYAQLAAVEPIAEIGEGGVGELRMGDHFGPNDNAELLPPCREPAERRPLRVWLTGLY